MAMGQTPSCGLLVNQLLLFTGLAVQQSRLCTCKEEVARPSVGCRNSSTPFPGQTYKKNKPGFSFEIFILCHSMFRFTGTVLSDFFVLGLASSIPAKVTGWEERLQND